MSAESIVSPPTSDAVELRRRSSRTLQVQNVRRSNSQSSVNSAAERGGGGGGYHFDESEVDRERRRRERERRQRDDARFHYEALQQCGFREKPKRPKKPSLMSFLSQALP